MLDSEIRLKLAWAPDLKTLVPKPSLARMAAEEKTKEADPEFLTRKTMLNTLPLDPVKPGVGAPPLKDKVPAAFEKVGSSTQREKIDPDLLKETTSKRPLGKFIVASALLTATLSVSIKTLTVKILPTVKLPDDGLKYAVAAWALFCEIKIPDKTKADRSKSLKAIPFFPRLLSFKSVLFISDIFFAFDLYHFKHY